MAVIEFNAICHSASAALAARSSFMLFSQLIAVWPVHFKVCLNYFILDLSFNFRRILQCLMAVTLSSISVADLFCILYGGDNHFAICWSRTISFICNMPFHFRPLPYQRTQYPG
jgi:hypothetical protein